MSHEREACCPLPAPVEWRVVYRGVGSALPLQVPSVGDCLGVSGRQEGVGGGLEA